MRVDCRLETFLSKMNKASPVIMAKNCFWGMGSSYKCWVQLPFMCPVMRQAEDATAYLMICVCLLALWPLIIVVKFTFVFDTLNIDLLL